MRENSKAIQKLYDQTVIITYIEDNTSCKVGFQKKKYDITNSFGLRIPRKRDKQNYEFLMMKMKA
jgi:hypothetical protein